MMERAANITCRAILVLASLITLFTKVASFSASPIEQGTVIWRTNGAVGSGTKRPVKDPPTDSKTPAYPQQAPHSGCHFLPSHPGCAVKHKGPKRKGRFFEGWYYRITIPEEDASFAFIFSVEDPGRTKRQRQRESDIPKHTGTDRLNLSCAQIMGPNDTYLVQADRDDTKFWAWKHQQGLGCTFEFDNEMSKEVGKLTTAIHPDEWDDLVQTGFQMLPNRLQGKLKGHDGSKGGVLEGQGEPGECTFDLTIDPIVGWGDIGGTQKSTAGWLARYSVFEPHWQSTIADARASGTVKWKGKTYNVKNVPFYAEKNWGGAFPIKWYWAQCNAFEGYMGNDATNHLAVTAGGGTRKIPFGQTESLGMVSVHYNGVFYEAVPWTGTMEWEITPWGSWIMKGRCTKGERPFEVEIIAKCGEDDGVELRAPTEDEGMVYFCRDSFYAKTTLTLWELEYDKDSKKYHRKGGPPLIDRATSRQGAVEVGGGPWWDTWKGVSDMKQPMRGLVRLPYRVDKLRKRLFGGKTEQ